MLLLPYYAFVGGVCMYLIGGLPFGVISGLLLLAALAWSLRSLENFFRHAKSPDGYAGSISMFAVLYVMLALSVTQVGLMYMPHLGP